MSSYTTQTTNITNFSANQSAPNLTRNQTTINDHHHDDQSVLSDPVYSLNINNNNITQISSTATTENHFDSCSGRYIYFQDLPSQFNEDLLKNCYILEKPRDMCPYVSHNGFGTKLEDDNSKMVLMENGWFMIDQFTLEVIFHNSMKKYMCLTNDSYMAWAIFVPYYSGLDVAPYLLYKISVRDASARKLVEFLEKRPECKTVGTRPFHDWRGGCLGFQKENG
ncbi:hypothetical protein FNV43_RR02020 [Rhamnella rubrinervis]|uniref:Exostosin GT47 domain-containing protein n=1 Tax=Rhamnella rubrinervis TaxID=2594499 RepID=A0A8K0HT90_9ROSA|nr:hypothetical protein FNV43_RR02020 [Rhamnella rubrinervis]